MSAEPQTQDTAALVAAVEKSTEKEMATLLIEACDGLLALPNAGLRDGIIAIRDLAQRRLEKARGVS